MSELAALRLRLSAIERDRDEQHMHMKRLQDEIKLLQFRLTEKESEVRTLRTKLSIEALPNGGGGNHYLPSALDNEVEKLKVTVESLTMANEEKDRKIDELKRYVRRFRKIQEMVLNAQAKKALEAIGAFDVDNSDTSSLPSLSSESNDTGRPSLTSYEAPKSSVSSNGHEASIMSSLMSSYDKSSNGVPSPAHSVNGNGKQHHTNGTHQSVETLDSISSKTPPLRHRNNASRPPAHPGSVSGHIATLPRPRHDHNVTETAVSAGPQSELSEDDASSSCYGSDHFSPAMNRKDSTGDPRLKPKESKGLKRFFGRIRRSGSQNLDDDGDEPFQRGGLRATAGPRLMTSSVPSMDRSPGNVTFARWTVDQIVRWLHELGLGMYVTDCRRWVRNGLQMLKATQQDLEKELGVKNPLHRKKLYLALQAQYSNNNGKEQDYINTLDYHWVTKWLDDIGLPQYKDSFQEARIDGRMLHYLTFEDLLHLKVVNELHHVSIKRAIQVLRLNSFNPSCLKRRPSGDEKKDKVDVMLWTNHRVMEWLRLVDLSEYAPNLRGSGVHGGLMVFEARFNSETFAAILSIPNAKTLLRRHLTTHFTQLVGAETQAMKREAEAMPGYVPLNSSTKVKRGIFGHKRSRSQSDIDNLICPMDSTSSLDQPPSTNGSVSNGSVSNGGVSNGAVSNGGVANGGLSNGAVHNGAIANGNGIHHDEEQLVDGPDTKAAPSFVFSRMLSFRRSTRK